MESSEKSDAIKDSSPVKPAAARVSFFASVKLTIMCMAAIATTILLGAWCPQESQMGREKVFETFPPDMANALIKLGIADIFHTPFFLFLIAMLTVNMVACSFQRVFPKIRTMKLQMPFLSGGKIDRMPFVQKLRIAEPVQAGAALSAFAGALERKRFVIRREDRKITAEYGKFSRLAATVTHIGLLTLMLGVTITSWTGFSGFIPVRLGDSMAFGSSEHSRLWVGKLPDWSVKVLETRRENYESGDPKQWYSKLSVVDADGKVQKTGEISVNNPLSYDGVDIYQSTWGLDTVVLNFSGAKKELPLQPMGKRYAAFLPLDGDSVLIFSVLDQSSPLRLFAKRGSWQAPRLISEIKPGEGVELGGVKLGFEGVVPITGLQYKSDPGLPIVYVAFGLIMIGVMMATVPHQQLWLSLEDENDQASPGGASLLYVGGRSVKAKAGFERLIARISKQTAESLSGVEVLSPVEEVPEESESGESTTSNPLESLDADTDQVVSESDNGRAEVRVVPIGSVRSDAEASITSEHAGTGTQLTSPEKRG